MFFAGSRYERADTVLVQGPFGDLVPVVRVSPRSRPAAIGYHLRIAGQRLDLIARRHLADPTAFWRLCDANGTIAPDALAVADRVHIPEGGG